MTIRKLAAAAALAALATTAAPLAVAATTDTTPTAGGEVFTDPDGAFSVVFPTTPEVETTSEPTVDGPVAEATVYVSSTDTFGFAVSVLQFPPEITAYDFDLGQQGILDRLPGAELVEQSDVERDGFAGRQFVVSFESGGVAGTSLGEIYYDATANRAVVANAVGQGTLTFDDPDVVAFFDSLTLTGGTGATPGTGSTATEPTPGNSVPTSGPAAGAYVAPEGDFTVAFPSEPTVVPVDLSAEPNNDAESLTNYGTADGTYVVNRITFPAGIAFDFAERQAGALAALGETTVVEEGPIDLGGVPGQQAVVDVVVGGTPARVLLQTYFVAETSTAYQVIYVSADTAVTFESPEAAPFFQSFQIL